MKIQRTLVLERLVAALAPEDVAFAETPIKFESWLMEVVDVLHKGEELSIKVAAVGTFEGFFGAMTEKMNFQLNDFVESFDAQETADRHFESR